MKYFSDYMSEAQTKLFNENGVFFAFSNEQFNENKQENIKYVSLPGGMICPKDKVKTVINELDKIADNAVDQDIKDNGAKKIIEREYFNHECQISMDTDSAKSAFYHHSEKYPDLFTEEIINKTFNECFQLAVKNDWF